MGARHVHPAGCRTSGLPVCGACSGGRVGAAGRCRHRSWPSRASSPVPVRASHARRGRAAGFGAWFLQGVVVIGVKIRQVLVGAASALRSLAPSYSPLLLLAGSARITWCCGLGCSVRVKARGSRAGSSRPTAWLTWYCGRAPHHLLAGAVVRAGVARTGHGECCCLVGLRLVAGIPPLRLQGCCGPRPPSCCMARLDLTLRASWSAVGSAHCIYSPAAWIHRSGHLGMLGLHRRLG